MALGFRGQYWVRGEEGFAAVMDGVGRKLNRLLPPTDIISPKGLPESAARSIVRREAPIVGVALGLLVLSVLVFVVLRIVLGVSASSAVDEMKSGTEQAAK
jgi:type VI protein secretion system component VasF